MKSRIKNPVTEIIKAANMTMDDIDSVVLIGGGTRMPFVQDTLAEVATKEKLARNLNADEACTMGHCILRGFDKPKV